MPRVKTLQALFQRNRRPGDNVFACFFLIVSLVLLSQLLDQTTFRPNSRMFAQPRFWPALSLVGMVVFASFHLLGSALSKRLNGRWQEVALWLGALEYAGWFIAYAFVVPFAGYLPTTLIFTLFLVLRAGYRKRSILISGVVSAILIVVLFKTFLQVKLPAGQIYEVLPDGLRQIMLTYF